MKIIAIIQARMGSSRLPGKVLRLILDKPLLWYIVQRLKSIPEIKKIIVATSDKKNDDPIVKFCSQEDITVFRGSEDDVLDRFYQAAKREKPEAVVRITGDCPLIDPKLIRKLLILFIRSRDVDHYGLATGAGVADQEFNHARFPDGLDAEIIRFKALEQAWLEAKDPLEREHVTPFIWSHPKLFRIGCLTSDKDYSSMRWTVDRLEDFELIKHIYEALYKKNPYFGMEETIGYLETHPELIEKNAHFAGQEGYEVFRAKK